MMDHSMKVLEEKTQEDFTCRGGKLVFLCCSAYDGSCFALVRSREQETEKWQERPQYFKTRCDSPNRRLSTA